MSFANYSKEDLQKQWAKLNLSSCSLVIATTNTRNYSKWPFIFRNKIISLLAPPEVKILNIDYDYKILSEQETISLRREKDVLKKGKTVHGIMIRDLQDFLPSKSLCLLLDIDAYPLNKESIMISFLAAQENGVFGNIQGYGDHLYIAPSFMCFDNEIIKSKIGEKAWLITDRSDVGGEITWIMPEILEQDLFRPIKTIFKPIWKLSNSAKPSIGVGTTFGYKNKPMTYHHFYSRVEVSKIHFFFVSFFSYIKVKLLSFKELNKIDKFRKIRFYLRHEIKWGIKYITNTLYEKW